MSATLTIVADDLTGACDTGALFAGPGPVPVAIWPQPAAEAAVRVIDTESRTLEATAAAKRVWAAAAAAPAPWLLKKIDSTLRGRVGAETEAALEAGGLDTALVCPALPAHGRTIVDRMLWVDGVPVARTPVALDPEFPRGPAASRLGSPDITELLRPQVGRPLGWIPLAEVRAGQRALGARLERLRGTIVVADAENDADLDALAEAALGAPHAPLLVGSAGLARAVSAQLGLLAGACALPRGRWLVVAGSRHPVTRRQVAAARSAGFRVLASPDHDAANRASAARALAEAARAALETERFDAVLVTGGETALALIAALGADGLDLHGAPRPGLALGSVPRAGRPPLPVVTKAGGFGTDGLIAELAREAA